MESVKKAVAAVTNDAKTADMQRNILDPSSTSEKGQRADYGAYISNTDNWLKVSDGSSTGPFLLEDHIGREKVSRFDHERIPERIVHARGAGAHGIFKVYDDRASKYTHAEVLTDASRETPIFVRFSTVQGSRGSADTVRDVRGFAVKFYTPEGNWDIVGNDIPIFFIQDAIKFPDLVHAVKPEPDNEVPTGQSAHNNFWDYVGLQPEATHMIMWVMSDRGVPRSYRMMQGFGVNTYTLINAAGERVFVKFTWTPELGVHSFVWDEALKICGQDPDFHRKDLEEAITTGAYPKWKFGIQTIPESRQHDFEFDILDATKVWPEELVPIEYIGEMTLNRMVDEYFPEVEQVAFCTSHLVPGIGLSDDPLLQGRNFSYFDTQISRLGINWQELPINRPICPVLSNHRDGKSRHKITKGSINYWPNRKGVLNPVPVSEGGYAEYAQKVAGIKQRVRGAKFQEHYNQAQLFFNSLAPHEKAHLINAIGFELDHCDDPVVYQTYTKILNNVDFNLAKEVAVKVGGTVPEGPGKENRGQKSASLSQTYFAPKEPTIKSRRIAILLADGFDAAEVLAIRAVVKSGSATSWLIGPRRSKVYPAGQKVGEGEGMMADHHWEGMRSTMFDALVIPSGAEHAKTLAGNGRTVHWVREAFGHCKTIGAIGEGVAFLRDAVALPEVHINDAPGNESVTCSYGVVTTGKYGAKQAGSEALSFATGAEKGFISNFLYEVSKHRCYERELDGLTGKIAY